MAVGVNNIQLMQQGQALWEEYLYHDLFETGILCEFCRQSEQMLQCDILMSQIKCSKHICLKCFKIKKDDPCQCGTKYYDHYVKDGAVKPSFKYGYQEEAGKSFLFPREQKIRKKTEYQNQNTDLISLLAYLYANPPIQDKRISYYELEKKIKLKLKDKKKEQEAVKIKTTVKKKAQFLGRDQGTRQETGLQSCGYQRTYIKGRNLVWNSFFPLEPNIIEHSGEKLGMLNQKSMSAQSIFKQFQLQKPQEKEHKPSLPSINA